MAQTFDVIDVSENVERKINQLHHLQVDDVLDVLEAPEHMAWDDDAGRGRRLLVVGTLRGKRVLVVLYPIPGRPNEWRLATAYPDHRR